MGDQQETSSRTTLRSPVDELARHPYRFDFFQAVRMLQWAARERAMEESPTGRSVGRDFAPEEEVVRFRGLASLSFPSSSISKFRPSRDPVKPSELQVTFLGLFGPHGVLPRHYTQMIIDRARRKDTTLRDFLDAFNHRVLSLFWRAWAKHRLPIAYEDSKRDPQRPTEDPFTRLLYCLAGVGLRGQRDRLEVPDSAFLYYAGAFSHARPQSVTLERIVADQFGIGVACQQFVGQWLQLDEADQSRMGTPTLGRRHHEGWNNQLGRNVVVGERVWSVENRFRLRLGPLGYEQFSSLMPAGRLHVPLAQFVRSYVGPEYDFDIQLVLRRNEVPGAKLPEREQPAQCRLGWNSWIFSQPKTQDADDAAFACEGGTSRHNIHQGSQT